MKPSRLIGETRSPRRVSPQVEDSPNAKCPIATGHEVLVWIAQSALWLAAGCTLAVDTTVPSGCGENADCAEGGTCLADGSCSYASSPACSTDTECSNGGRGDFCVNGQCIPDPINADCPRVSPESAWARDENKLLIGFIGDIAEDVNPNPYGKPTLEGLEFALDRIQRVSNGLPGVGGVTQRNVVALICNEIGSTEEHPARVARHLVEDAAVSAIVGASFSSGTIQAWSGYVQQSSALLISPSATSPLLTDFTARVRGRDPLNQLWRTSPSDAVQGALLASLAAELRTQLGGADRLMVFVKGDAAGDGLRNAVREPLNAAFQLDVEYVEYAPAQASVDWDAMAARALAAPLPNIILGLGTQEFVEQLLPRIEAAWPVGRARPWYVLPEGDRHESLMKYDQEHADLGLNQRVIGTAPGARKSPRFDAFRQDFTGISGHAPGNLAEFGYDAGYLLMYALARVDAPFPNGLQIGQGLTELGCKAPGSVTIAPGTQAFVSGFETASISDCVDYQGASGELDFDAHGEAVSDIGVWCLRRRDNLTLLDPTLDQYYDSLNETLTGAPFDFNDPGWCPTAP